MYQGTASPASTMANVFESPSVTDAKDGPRSPSTSQGRPPFGSAFRGSENDRQ